MLLIGFAKGLAETSPEAINDFMGKLAPGNTRDHVAGLAIRALLKTDVNRALALYDEQYEEIKAGTTSELKQLSELLVMAFVEKLPEAELGGMMHGASFQRLMQNDYTNISAIAAKYPQLAVRFAQDMDSRMQSLQAFSVIAYLQLQLGDAKTICMVIAQAEALFSEEQIIENVINIHDSPYSAFDYLEHLPETSYDALAFQIAARILSPVSVQEWIANLEQGPRKDNAIAGLSYSLFNEDFDAAVKWADSIQDESLRTEVLSRINSTPP